jgi:hypothetical protein
VQHTVHAEAHRQLAIRGLEVNVARALVDGIEDDAVERVDGDASGGGRRRGVRILLDDPAHARVGRRRRPGLLVDPLARLANVDRRGDAHPDAARRGEGQVAFEMIAERIGRR